MLPTELVFPAVVGLAAGWSWAMWAIHATVSATVAATSAALPDPLLVEDKRVAPPRAAGKPIAGTYVDNFAIVGRSKSDASARYLDIKNKFSSLGVALHELVECDPDEPFEQLGIHFIAGCFLRWFDGPVEV